MRSSRLIAFAVPAMAALALGLPGVRPAGSTALAAGSRPEARLGYDPATGRLIFVGTRPGQSLPSSVAGAAAVLPEANARSFIREYAQQLGLRDPDSELKAFRTVRRRDGRTVVRYRQVHDGVPIFGADLVVNTDRDGALLAMSAKISPEPTVDTVPTLTPDEAQQLAVPAIAKYHRTDVDSLRASTPELWIYDARLLLPDGRPPVLAWKLEVTDGAAIREMVFVEATRGAIALHYNQVDTTWRTATSTTQVEPTPGRGDASPQVLGTPLLSVYTMGNTTGWLPGSLVCSEAGPAACDGDADTHAAYQYGLDTYNFYANSHGRDSIDNLGMRIVQSVHYGVNYQNAFWNGSQMVFGDGFPAADDVVAHELTHGVTTHESALIYYGQSGAINESFSDIWGEFVDLGNGQGTDTPAVKWMMGEDVPGFGAIRSMKNPPAFGDPDTMTSAYYYTGSSDNYGVHTNSGVSNKAAYLMVEGGTFGGKTITPLGIEKVADIYYEAQANLIGSGTNYIDLYYALHQACLNLVGTGGITLGDCQAVRDTTDAVQMNKTRSAIVYPTVDYCPVGQSVDPAHLFDDDLEGGSGNWTFDALYGPSLWSLDTLRRDSSSGPTALVWNLYGNPSTSDSYAAMNADVVLPAGSRAYLRFEHDLWGFEYFGPYFYDGGVVEYSSDGGVTWLDLSPKYAGGKNYGGVLSSSWGNPIGGRKAFTGWTVSYTESRYSLSSLAGGSFRVRFRTGTDSTGTSYPWFVDDVRIYTCATMPTRPTLLTPANNALLTDYTPRLDWSDSTGSVASYHVQIGTDSAFTALVYDEPGLGVSEFTVPADLTPGTKHYWRVRSQGGGDASAGWTVPGFFRTIMTPPVLVAPPDGAAAHARRPTFDWNDVDGASGYTVQVSKVPTFAPVVLTGTVATAVSTFTPTADLPANTFLYWRARANGANGPSLWSSARTITTGNPPSVPALLLPALNALTTDYTPRFDWGTSIVPVGTTFDSYELQVDDNADFSSPTIDALVPGIGAHEYTPLADLAANTKFYWRVRSWSTAGDFSGWSAVRYFRAAMMPPVLSGPADGTNVQSRRPTFDWDDVAGATGYALQASKVPNFVPVVLTSTIATATSTFMPTTDLPANTLIYWRVRANGANGPTLWSSARTITTGNPPSVPALLLPALNALSIDYAPRLDWGVSIVPVGTTFDHYQLEVDDGADFSSLAIGVDVPGLVPHEYTPGVDLAANAKYYWRVRSWNTAGDSSAWSAVRYFRAAMTPPVLDLPADGGYADTRRPTFDWDDVVGATGYTLQVSRVASFAPVVLATTIATANSTLTPTADLPGNALLYWRVRANGANGPSAWSGAFRFTTPNPPSTPVLLSPANGAVISDLTPRLDWGISTVPAGTTFSHYELQVNEANGYYSLTVWIYSLFAHEYTPTSNLWSGSTYYWRVRSWNTAGEASAWSPTRSFRTTP